MPIFIIRVELNNAASNDYARLDPVMEKEGFERTITADDGVKYQLPTGEYYRLAQLTGQQIRQSGENAANKIGKGCAIVVTESNAVTWNGLKKV